MCVRSLSFDAQTMSDARLKIAEAEFKAAFMSGEMTAETVGVFENGSDYTKGMVKCWRNEKRFKSRSLAKQGSEMRKIRNLLWDLLNAGMNVHNNGRDALRVRSKQSQRLKKIKKRFDKTGKDRHEWETFVNNLCQNKGCGKMYV